MTFDVYAIKYAERDALRSEHFSDGDPHDNAPMPMDYYVWLIMNDAGHAWVVDTGFEQDDAAARHRTLQRTAAEAVALFGVEAQNVQDVILTHFHYDHAGGVRQFPNATFHVQDAEMAFVTGRQMANKSNRQPFSVRHVQDLVGRLFADKVQFHTGVSELVPGLSLHHVGGHTPGMQVVRVDTGNGVVVLASDASHFYVNLEERRPYRIASDVDEMVKGWDTLRSLSGEDGVIVPGHDPLVLQRFPVAREGLEGVAVRLSKLATERGKRKAEE
eukprot:TRINITY_DN68520_c0_g1_i1.p1 TRINITY_DN68520_c0_g1~~TRINITY_DN68520_c0_g1_i1.p1  ORF type:complete len:273 (-),score=39.72 TRINITY_DN68520_c0_g1_i1:90-908(-)